MRDADEMVAKCMQCVGPCCMGLPCRLTAPCVSLKFWAGTAGRGVVRADGRQGRGIQRIGTACLSRWLSWAQAWATLGLLIWFGHIATYLAWLWVMGDDRHSPGQGEDAAQRAPHRLRLLGLTQKVSGMVRRPLDFSGYADGGNGERK